MVDHELTVWELIQHLMTLPHSMPVHLRYYAAGHVGTAPLTREMIERHAEAIEIDAEFN